MIDYGAITQPQQQIWATGDSHPIERHIMCVGEDLVRTADRIRVIACSTSPAAAAMSS